MKIYTRTGDDGTTGLFRAGRLPKSHPLVSAMGTVDELNGFLGVARSSANPRQDELDQTILRVQHHLFDVGADLGATSPEMLNSTTVGTGPRGAVSEPSKAGRAEPLRISEGHVRWLEREIDRFEEGLPALQNFILPGGSPVAAQLHVARTVCRRAERELVLLAENEPVRKRVQPLAIYLNRLADLLFTLARQANQRSGQTDVIWNSQQASLPPNGSTEQEE